MVQWFTRNKREFLFAEELLAATLVFGLGIAAAVPFIFHTREIFFEESATLSLRTFLVFFLVASASIAFLVRMKKISLLRVIFFIVIFAGAFMFFQSFFKFSIVFFLAALFLAARICFPIFLTHNAMMVFALAGAGAFLGVSIEPWVAIALLILLSAYDYVSVFLTRRMIPLARASLDSAAPPAFLFPDDIRFFWKNISSYPKSRRLLFLGGGDIALPLLLSVSLLEQSVLKSFLVAAGSMFGLWAMHVIFAAQKRKTPLPALPPIAAGALFGFFLTLFV